jgi:hypothetical protein
VNKLIQICFAVVIGLFSPPIGWVVGILPSYLWGKQRGNKAALIYIGGFIAALFAGVAYSSRRKFIGSDDFSHYFDNFQVALSSHAPFFSYGGGSEIGLPLINYFFGLIFGELSPWHLMFLHQIVIFGLLIWVLSRTNVVGVSKSLLVAFVLVAFPYVLSTQLLRQCYSCLFLFLALSDSEIKVSRKLAAFTLAFLFQVSALPIFIFFYAAKTLKGYWFIAFNIVTAFLVIKFQEIAEVALAADQFVGQDKFQYYAFSEGGWVKSDLIPLEMYSLILLLVLFAKLYKKKWTLDGNEKILFTAFSFSLAAMPVALLGLRVCLVVYLFIGVYVVKAASGISKWVVRAVFLLILIYQLKIMFLSPEGSDFELWREYPAFSIFPGYFLLN